MTDKKVKQQQTPQDMEALNPTEAALAEMKQRWGGELTDWEAFREAAYSDKVLVNRWLAYRAIYHPNVPAWPRWVYGYVLPVAALLVIPVFWLLFLLSIIGLGLALGSFFFCWLLFKAAFSGRVGAIRTAAENNEPLYHEFLNRGVFVFSPQVTG